MRHRLAWDREGLEWPHRDASRFVRAADLVWHVQQMGPANIGQNNSATRDGAATPPPVALLIHGTGASSHSWRGVMPLLAQHMSVFAIDLPGHGFTSMPTAGMGAAQFSLPGMARALGALLSTLAIQPQILIGHSAGAALALRMGLDGILATKAVVSVNGALLPPGGIAWQFFSPVAKLLSAAPLVPRLFAWRAADPAVLQRLIDGTGSTLDAKGLALYRTLVANPGHAAGALAMMANWDLEALAHGLPRVTPPVSLVVGSADRTVPPHQAYQAMALLPRIAGTAVTHLEGLGHLAHEERPDLLVNHVLELGSQQA